MNDLRILVDGNPVRKYFDRDGKIWVEARHGSRFEIKLTNDGWQRVLAVVSVDGLNIIDGKHENPETAKGYIINSYSSATIPGWKTGPDSAREFYFTADSSASYSKKIGADERNIGVIAAAFYKEKIKPVTWNTHVYSPNYTYTDSTGIRYRHRYGNSNCTGQSVGNTIELSSVVHNPQETVYSASCSSIMPDIEPTKMAVGSGDKVEYKTYKTEFERGELSSMITIYYDSYEGLRRRGVILEDKNYRNLPQAFPNGEFCPDL